MSETPRRFTILSAIKNIELIAEGRGIHIRQSLIESYGGRNWRKMKGTALVEKDDGWIGQAEIHWFEAHGVGRVRWKIKHKLSS